MMNVVVDNRISEACKELLNPKYHISYVDCRLESTEYELEELISNVYAKCVDRKADLFIGRPAIVEELRALGLNCISLDGGLDG